MVRRMFEPWNYYDMIFNLTPNGCKYRHCLKVLHDFTDQVSRSLSNFLVKLIKF